MKDLATTTNAIAQAAVGVDRIRAILDTDTIIPEKADAIEPAALIKGDIEFDHVALAISVDAKVLKDVSFNIKPGQLVGIVGPTGSGKSTVVSLIPRFYDPAAGSGADRRHATCATTSIKGLRDQIGYVLQDTVLFRGTILENIAFGQPGRDAGARSSTPPGWPMRMSSSRACRKGYDTMVGERGVTLSGGQRQRIGIARVMVRNSPILLLDEPTAALDSESEKLVIDALEG